KSSSFHCSKLKPFGEKLAAEKYRAITPSSDDGEEILSAIAPCRFHGAVSVAFPIGLGFHTRTIGESDASIDRRHAHRRPLWHNFRCDRTEPEELAGDAAQSGQG